MTIFVYHILLPFTKPSLKFKSCQLRMKQQYVSLNKSVLDMKGCNFFILLFLIATQSIHAQIDSVYLWPNNIPNQTKPKGQPIITTIDDGTTRVTEVTNPFFAVFKPVERKKNNKAIIVCPGGGYVRLAVHKEGYTVANWLAGLGYTVFVLQYCVPNNRDGALQDMQRTLKLIRHDAKKYEIDPNKIGAIGFSAGAHVVARAGMADSTQTYPTQDAADTEYGRPNCMVIIYPGYLDGGPNKTLTPELKANAKTVDTFIFQAMDDAIVQSSFALAMALRDVKANVELHLVPKGGHGFGMNAGNKAAETWPGLLAPWLKDHL
jgi:acetyl esterase/lipase